MIGSLTFLSSEYDDFMRNFARISLDNQTLIKEVEQMKYKQLQSEKQLDQLEHSNNSNKAIATKPLPKF